MGKARSRKFGLGFEITTKGTRRVEIKSSARWHQQGCRVGRWLQPGGLIEAEVAAGPESPVIPIDAAASLEGNRENK